MIKNWGRIILLGVLILRSLAISCQTVQRPSYVLVIHGGAGGIGRENMTAEQEEAYLSTMVEALGAGEAILKGGGSSNACINGNCAIIVTVKDAYRIPTRNRPLHCVIARSVRTWRDKEWDIGSEHCATLQPAIPLADN